MDSEPTSPEPWLRGPIDGIIPLVMPVFFSFALVREDLQRHASGLSDEQVWRRLPGAPSLGFHLKHIAGSVDRLTTYLFGGELRPDQLDFLRNEQVPGAGLDELLEMVEKALKWSEQKLQTLDPQSSFEPRSVGRRRLPTSVIGLLVHLAEHTQRHLGQAVTTANLVRSLPAGF